MGGAREAGGRKFFHDVLVFFFLFLLLFLLLGLPLVLVLARLINLHINYTS